MVYFVQSITLGVYNILECLIELSLGHNESSLICYDAKSVVQAQWLDYICLKAQP